ncbi:MAG: patatin-like phospholipase family protein [Planctomycetes bacterium]|nr:patatin-like phospholipase family protein [Planctomycetota bacterium]
MAPDLHSWLAREPFTLVLSGGFFGFFAHTGFLLALEEAGLRPARIVGCSAGALAGGAWASGVPLAKIQDRLASIERKDFWDPGFPWGGLLAGRAFQRLLHDLLVEHGVTRIEDCPTPCGVVVFDTLRLRARTLVEGRLARAVRASCSVPGMFRPVRWGRTFLLDGGVTDRPGFTALRADERVLYHHLIEGRETPADAPGQDRAATQVLCFAGVPAVNPYKLPEGPRALSYVLEQARERLATGVAVS